MIKFLHVAALAVVVLAPLGWSFDESHDSAPRVAAPERAAAYSAVPGRALSLPITKPGAPKSSSTRSAGKVEQVEIKTNDDQALSASFYPSRKSGRAPAVLLIHDAGSDRTPFEKVAKNLQKRGFAVLSMDLRGHGSSVNEAFNWVKASDEDHARTWAFAMRDLDAACCYLRKRDDVHNSNLSLVGVGAGAALAVKYALRDENARAVVLVNPQPEAFGYDMYKDVFELGGLPTMILTPKADRKQAERLKVAANKGNDGIEYVQLKVLKPKKNKGPLTDKRLPKEVSDFLRDEAMEGR